MTYEIEHADLNGRLYFRNPRGHDFASPATQDSLRNMDAPMWETSMSSRCPHLPFWDRPDPLRQITHSDTMGIQLSPPSVSYPAMDLSPSGKVMLRDVHRNPQLVISDAHMYHVNTQKVFSLLLQMDTLLPHQVAAFTGLSLEDAVTSLETLHHGGVVDKPRGKWIHGERLGSIYRLNPYSAHSAAYLEGMDVMWRMLAAGDLDLRTDAPPGAGAESSIRHNISMAEILLRVAENSDLVAGIWGDLFTSEHLLHDGTEGAKRRRSHGDGAIVTKDGSLIILELTGAAGGYQKIMEKAASWVGVIAHSHLDISVLFIDTTWLKDRKDIFRAVDIGVRTKSAAYAPERVLRERAQKKIGIVNSTWWFPEDNTVSRAATRLGAWEVIGRKFREFDVADDFYSSSEKRKNLVMNTVSALHTPPWISKDIKDRWGSHVTETA